MMSYSVMLSLGELISFWNFENQSAAGNVIQLNKKYKPNNTLIVNIPDSINPFTYNLPTFLQKLNKKGSEICYFGIST